MCIVTLQHCKSDTTESKISLLPHGIYVEKIQLNYSLNLQLQRCQASIGDKAEQQKSV